MCEKGRERSRMERQGEEERERRECTEREKNGKREINIRTRGRRR